MSFFILLLGKEHLGFFFGVVFCFTYLKGQGKDMRIRRTKSAGAWRVPAQESEYTLI